MRFIPRLLVLLSLFMSAFSVANWEYDFQPVPEPKAVASDIALEVNQIPEPLFMTKQDYRKVSLLLNAVLQEQDKQRDVFDNHLVEYRKESTDQAWFDVETSYLTLNSLALSKQRLLELTDSATRERLTGFGPYGVTQFKRELKLTQLNVKYLFHFQVRSFKSLINDLLISPIPVIWAGLKVLFIYFGLVWWLANNTRLINLFRSSVLDNNPNPPIWIRVIWYFGRANTAIAWLIAITLSLRVLSAIPSLQHLILLEIFTWWISWRFDSDQLYSRVCLSP